MPILVDSSFLYSLADKDDKTHIEARDFIRRNHDALLVPDVTLVEVTHVLNQRFGHHTVTVFLRLFLKFQIPLEPISKSDTQRALEIMETYSDARFDFVDGCIMALTERLNVTQVCTFDRRDFVIFRPKHCDYLELLP